MASTQQRFAQLLIFISMVLSVPFSFGAEPDGPRVIAIQRRNYHLTNELGGYLSYMPLDSFTQYFNTGANLTHYFNDYLGWEVFNGAYANSSSTGLKDYILNNFNAFPEVYDVINYYVTTN